MQLKRVTKTSHINDQNFETSTDVLTLLPVLTVTVFLLCFADVQD